MSDFTATPVTRPDPLKRVNYTFGLVLGVDEFLQEQTYFVEKALRHNRFLHGYGTMWGLKLQAPAGPDAQVVVLPGAAATPAGHEVCVPTRMCARVDDWLMANAQALRDRLGDPPFPLTLCVVLCYRECETDVVPLPGEPCRSEDDALAPSRILQSFELKLCVDAGPLSIPVDETPPFDCPVHTAQAAGLAAFARVLHRVTASTSGAVTFSTSADIENEVRDLETISVDDTGAGADTSPLYVKPEEQAGVLAAAARVWATEVLPALLGRDGTDCCDAIADSCVLLGTVSFDVDATLKVVGGAGGLTLDESTRPILLSTAVLQDCLLAGGPGTTV